MKFLKTSLFILFAFVAFNNLNAQEKIENMENHTPKEDMTLAEKNAKEAKSDPNKDNGKGTINSSDKKSQKVKYDGIEYYVIDGIWYTKFKSKYVLRQAPKGAKTYFIPAGGKMVTMGGVNYYKCKGVFYKKTNKSGVYEIVRP